MEHLVAAVVLALVMAVVVRGLLSYFLDVFGGCGSTLRRSADWPMRFGNATAPYLVVGIVAAPLSSVPVVGAALSREGTPQQIIAGAMIVAVLRLGAAWWGDTTHFTLATWAPVAAAVGGYLLGLQVPLDLGPGTSSELKLDLAVLPTLLFAGLGLSLVIESGIGAIEWTGGRAPCRRPSDERSSART